MTAGVRGEVAGGSNLQDLLVVADGLPAASPTIWQARWI
jgi:hypothetical protein